MYSSTSTRVQLCSTTQPHQEDTVHCRGSELVLPDRCPRKQVKRDIERGLYHGGTMSKDDYDEGTRE